MSSSGGLGRGTLPKSYVFSMYLMYTFSLNIMCLVGSLCGSSLDSHQRARCSISNMGGIGDWRWYVFGSTLKTKSWGWCVGARLATSA